MYDLIILYKQDIDKDRLKELLQYILNIDEESSQKMVKSFSSTFAQIGTYPLEIAEMKNVEVQNWAHQLSIEVFSKIEKNKEGNKKNDTKSRIQNSHN